MTSVEADGAPPAIAEVRMPPLLRVDDLRTWFPTPRGVVHAVDGVSFELGASETLGIVGESGSGKSVLARSVMGLLQGSGATFPTGTVHFRGEDLLRATPARLRRTWRTEIAMVFQNPMTALNPVVRIGRQIGEAVDQAGLTRADRGERVCELLRAVGIPDPRRRARQYPHELSGGMRQRVMIAIALAKEPSLLISDEPTTALDVTVQAQILDLIESKRRERGMSQILISHDLGIMAGRTDRIAVMYAGRIVEQAPTAELFANPRMPYTRALLDAIPDLHGAAHQRLATIGGHPPDLVDVPDACRFAPRCHHRTDVCSDSEPRLEPVGDAHTAACHFPHERRAPAFAAAYTDPTV